LHNPDKLTQAQKRGIEPGKGSNWEFHNDKRNMEAPKPRSARELRNAQERLAEMALEQEDPKAWLREVLEALDLRSRQTPKTLREENCGPYAGTIRGYKQHLKAYTRPCNMCDEKAREEEASRLSRLGLQMEVGQWQISMS